MRIYLLFMFFFMLIQGCSSTRSSNKNVRDIRNTTKDSVSPNNDSKFRSFILNDDVITENENVRFNLWNCKDYYDGGQVIITLGETNISRLSGKLDSVEEDEPEIINQSIKNLQQTGIILFNRTNEGVFALNYRYGIDKRWDWTDERDNSFSVVLKSNGKAFFYNFISEEQVSPSATFKCKLE